MRAYDQHDRSSFDAARFRNAHRTREREDVMSEIATCNHNIRRCEEQIEMAANDPKETARCQAKLTVFIARREVARAKLTTGYEWEGQ